VYQCAWSFLHGPAIAYPTQNLYFSHSSRVHHSRKPISTSSHHLSHHSYIHTLGRHLHRLSTPAVSTSLCTYRQIAEWRLCVCELTGGALLAAPALDTGLLCRLRCGYRRLDAVHCFGRMESGGKDRRRYSHGQIDVRVESSDAERVGNALPLQVGNIALAHACHQRRGCFRVSDCI
jgi:hypothetical protein